MTDGAMPSRMLRTVSMEPTSQSFALGYGRIKPATNLVSFEVNRPAAGHCVGLGAHGPVEATP
jgi:hypothetical protein